MSRFHVGQRVRINCPESPRHGMTGIIWEIRLNARIFSHDLRTVSEGVTSHRLDIDGVGKRDSDGYGFAYRTDQLIPLDDGYDGRELASWATCPWRPERESAQKGAA